MDDIVECVSGITISVRGRSVRVPALRIGNTTVISTGKWLRIASIHDELWLPGQVVLDPDKTIGQIKNGKLKADLFTFVQKLPDNKPRFPYHYVLENMAAIRISTFDEWWKNKLPQETRKNVRRAAKRGVSVREVEFGDDLIRAIIAINNETPIRQGRPFWHYGKSFHTVMRDYATLMDRSRYICAFYGNKIIGFMKLVIMGDIAGILQILCMNAHQDKRPANALISHAVQMCTDLGITYLLYDQYIYANNTKSPLTEFKRRNGFEKILIPRYYVPLTLKGRLALLLGLPLDIKHLIPGRLYALLIKVRAYWYEKTMKIRRYWWK